MAAMESEINTPGATPLRMRLSVPGPGRGRFASSVRAAEGQIIKGLGALEDKLRELTA